METGELGSRGAEAPPRPRKNAATICAAVGALGGLRFDWDGEAGLPLRDDSGAMAVRWARLPHLKLERMPDPVVTLMPDGTIEVTFSKVVGILTTRYDRRRLTRKLQLWFPWAGVVTYAQTQTGCVTGRVDGDLTDGSPDSVPAILFDDMFRWFLDRSPIEDVEP